jgi:DNA-binding beta-propeller fold protein YncE
VDGAGNIYIVNEFGARPNIMEMPFAFVDPTSKLEGLAAGTDALPVVLPATANLLAPFAPTSDSSWLTISGVTNGVVSFAFTAATTTRTAQITLLGQTIAVTQIIPTLGTTNLLEGPTAGSDSVVLAVATPTAPWTATANAPWLYLSAANQSGTGSTNVVFSFDANPGATRSGTLTVGDQALTVTQAGSTYIAAGAATTLVSSGLNQPLSVAVDSTGNVYIADTVNRAVKKWTAANNTVTTLVSSNLISPYGVAVDGAGNVYFTSGSSLLQVWTATNNTVATLLSSGLNGPEGVAVDGVGNVYFADSFNKAIKEWTAANSNVTTLVSSGLNKPSGVTLDSAGNVYFADTAIKKWTAANSNLTALVSSGLLLTYGVAVDGSGNVYIGDNHYNSSTNAIKKWTAANNTVTTLVTTVVPSGAAYASGVAVDGVGNVYFADVRNNAVKELPYAFVDPTTKLESLAAGNDALPVVLPATANLLPPFAPASDQSWLTIIGITNGVVNFAFTAAGSHRTANITLLGQAIPVTQGSPYFLGTDALWEGPTAGTDGVLLTVIPGAGAWTATTNAGASWLHVSPANQSGTGSTYVVFSYDANPGATRSGTLIIGDQTLTVTQAGSTYVAAGQLTSLASGLSLPDAVTVDGAGNVYFVSAQDGSLKKWTVTSSTLTTLSSSFNWPNGIALDHAGNVYISAGQGAAIYEWSAANHNLTTLYSGEVGSWYPTGVALDGAGNVYFNNFDGGSLFKWTATDGIVTTLASSWGSSYGMAVDGMGNVYSASGGATITKWNATNGTVTHPISGLSSSWGVAVDIAGDLYIADAGDNTIKKWTAANQTLTTLVSSGLSFPADVAVDATGNVYIADGDNGAIKELPRAFVDPTPKLESLAAGNDALPVVLPPTANLTGPFAPASDSSWLAIGGINNGVVSFAFTATTTNRTAHITLLGQIIAITQTATVTPLVLTGGTILANGAFRFSFTNNQGASFTVLTTTNLASPMSNWTVVGTPTNSGSGLFQFTAPMSTNAPQLYYRVSSP